MAIRGRTRRCAISPSRPCTHVSPFSRGSRSHRGRRSRIRLVSPSRARYRSLGGSCSGLEPTPSLCRDSPSVSSGATIWGVSSYTYGPSSGRWSTCSTASGVVCPSYRDSRGRCASMDCAVSSGLRRRGGTAIPSSVRDTIHVNDMARCGLWCLSGRDGRAVGVSIYLVSSRVVTEGI